MKRILVLILISPFFINAAPPYEITSRITRDRGEASLTSLISPGEEFTHKTLRSVKHELNIKLLSVVNQKATIAYLINQIAPNRTSYQSWQSAEIETDALQTLSTHIPGILLSIKIATEPTYSFEE